jgi:hypothetical protein
MEPSETPPNAEGIMLEPSETKTPKATTLMPNAESTVKGDVTAKSHFDTFQDTKSDPHFDQLTIADVEADNLNALLADYGQYLATTTLKKLNAKDKDEVIAASSLVKYYEKIKRMLLDKFPTHPLGNVGASTEWWTSMRSAFVTLSARTQVKSHDNFKEKSTRGLFRHHTPRNALWPKLLGDDNPVHPKSKIPYAKDVCGIGHALIMESAASRHNNCYQQRAQIFQNMHATARSGEAKFVRWDELHWNEHFKVLEGKWREIKTLTKYDLTYTVDSEDYRLCLYHAHGCYFLVEKGLFRAEGPNPYSNIKHRAVPTATKFMFPTLHSVLDSTVAATHNRLIKRLVHPELKELVSSKSLRVGMITTMMVDTQLSEPQLLARSGHAGGNNTTSYTSSIPALTLPSSRCIAGWRNIHEPVEPPQWMWLGDSVQEDLEQFMKNSILVSLEQFKKGGKLRQYLKTCFVVLIMNHEKMLNDHGKKNPVVKKLADGAASVPIKDPRFPKEAGPMILMRWSKILSEAFLQCNAHQFRPPADSSEKLNYDYQNKMLGELKQDGMRREAKTDQVSAKCDRVMAENERLWKVVDRQASELLSRPRTPRGSPHKTPPASATRTLDLAPERVGDDAKRRKVEQSPVEVEVAADVPAEVVPAEVVADALHYDEQAVEVASCHKGLRLAVMITALHKLQVFSQDKLPNLKSYISEVRHLLDKNEDAKFNHCMDVTEHVLKTEEPNDLFEGLKTSDPMQIETMAHKVSDAVMACLLKAEGKTQVGSRMVPTILGFGGRISRLNADKKREIGIGGPPCHKMNAYFLTLPKPPKAASKRPNR